MAVRASDRVTLAVLTAVSYVRTYYLLQSSTLNPPTKPTANPPASPWTTTEPGYTAGSTNTLYTVQLVVYGDGGFDYGDVQKSSAYEAAKQAYNLAQQANNAAATADGRLSVADGAPTVADGAGKPTGAVWFRKDGAGRFIGAWEWSGSAWQARAIENAMIATLDAAKINTGYLDVANRVRAGAVSAEKIAIGDFTNYLAGGGFDNVNDLSNWSGSIGAIVTDDTAGSAGAVRVDGGASGRGLTQHVLTRPGQQWRITYSVKTTADYNGTGSNGKLRIGDQSGALKVAHAWPNTNGEWVDQVREYVVPEGMTQLQVRLSFDHSAGAIWLDNFEARRMNAGELVVDGSLTALKLNVEEIWANDAWLNVLRAGVIETSMVSAEFGKNLDITSNGTVNIIVSQQDELSNQVADSADAASTAADAAAAAALAASGAQSQADDAANAAAAAQAQNAATKAQLDKVAMHYRFGDEGAIIGRSDSQTQLHIKNTGIEIYEGAQKVTWWDGGQMVVPSLDTSEVALGNIKIEQVANGTVVKFVG